MSEQDLKEKIDAIIPMVKAFFEARGFEGIEQSIDRDTRLPKIGTLASDYDYQMSLIPKQYINAAPECELTFTKPSVGDKYYHSRRITLRIDGAYWKFSYKGQDYYFTEQVLEAVYDDD